MTSEEIELIEEEKKLKEKKEYIETRKVVTSLRCPLCGSPLRGMVYGPFNDTLDCKPEIFCDKKRGCGYFCAEGDSFSLYDKNTNKSLALQALIEKVRPYIKTFGSPCEEFI